MSSYVRSAAVDTSSCIACRTPPMSGNVMSYCDQFPCQEAAAVEVLDGEVHTEHLEPVTPPVLAAEACAIPVLRRRGVVIRYRRAAVTVIAPRSGGARWPLPRG